MTQREARFEDAGYKEDVGHKWSSEVFKKMWNDGPLVSEGALSSL